MTRPLRVFISAGETSGDRFGAGLAESLQRLCPGVELWGLGGGAMEAAGVRLVVNPLEHASIGIFSALRQVGAWSGFFRRCVSHFNRRRPDVVVPIDSPEFNRHLAGFARSRSIPVAYYVSPQFWAWRRGRIRRIAKDVDRMLCILPFEKALYDRVGCDAVYVGHPAMDYLSRATFDAAAEERIASLGDPVIGLLPGSRRQEVLNVFPIIAGAAAVVHRQMPEVRFVVANAKASHEPYVRSALRGAGVDAAIMTGKAWEVMRKTRICIAASGTVTLELAYFRRPMVIVYRGPRIHPWLAERILPRVLHTHFGLVNVIAGQEICREYLRFSHDDPGPIGKEVLHLLRNEDAWSAQRRDLEEVMRVMGGGGCSDRAAEAVLDLARR